MLLKSKPRLITEEYVRQLISDANMADIMRVMALLEEGLTSKQIADTHSLAEEIVRLRTAMNERLDKRRTKR